MIKEFTGTVFNTGAEAIVNTINVMGVMGAGIALEFSLRYPEMFKDYKKKCKEKQLVTGKVDYFVKSGDPIIVNFPTKWHWSYPSKIEWIEEGLQNFCNTYKQYGFKSVAFPKLGCSNGHLNWYDVYPIMRKYLEPLDIIVYVCMDSDNEAAGKELDMVNAYNSSDIKAVCAELKIPDEISDELVKNGIIYRFWQLNKVHKMESRYYKKIFKFFYDLNPGADSGDNVQLSFF